MKLSHAAALALIGWYLMVPARVPIDFDLSASAGVEALFPDKRSWLRNGARYNAAKPTARSPGDASDRAA